MKSAVDPGKVGPEITHVHYISLTCEILHVPDLNLALPGLLLVDFTLFIRCQRPLPLPLSSMRSPTTASVCW